MVGPSKILTVSYGTFSCTLEGFDEPFGTMQAIAEYFRDLAAQDRYFGAEPPTPDAEMLHRIAEREVQRRVESRVQENGIVLRQQADPAPLAAPYAMADALKSAVAPAAMMAAKAAPATPAQDVAEDQTTDAPAETPTEVSDKLARIRAAVAKSESTVPPVDDAADTVMTEDDSASENLPDMSAPEDDPDTLADTVAGMMDDENNIPEADEDESIELASDDTASDDTAPDDFDTDPEAAQQDAQWPDLAHALDQTPVQSPDQPKATDLPRDDFDDFGLFDEDDEDLPTAAPAKAPVSAPVQVSESVASAEAATPAPEAQAEEDEFEDDDDTPEDTAPQPEAIKPQQQTPAAPQRAEPTDDFDDDDFDDDEFEAELERELQDAERLEQERHSIESLRSEIRAVLGNTGLPGGSERALVDELAEIEQEAVIKHPHFNRKAKKRIPGDTEATAERLLETANSELGARDSKRRRETFEHIKVAVAATRAEEVAEGPRRRDIEQDREIDKYREGMDTPAPLDAAISRAEQQAKPSDATQARPDTGVADDSWDEEDAAPIPVAEKPKRRPAELRPAPEPVAAVPEAPVDAPTDTPVEEMTPPRPRRPAMAGARRSERPAPARSPLVLVSELRVDAAETAAPTGPVRPRRVRAAPAAEILSQELAQAPAASDTLDAFKTFANDVDAWLLDDQIEAAAAYSTHILGQSEFSRPELMKFVLAYNEGKDVSREDMLRGFGTLLREGRLERGDAGQFRLAPASEYDEPARKYAQR